MTFFGPIVVAIFAFEIVYAAVLMGINAWRATTRDGLQ